ncbi:MAG: T9SS type A sorting domain-containing protein, partial [Bacteroidales bacterium]|nr:T9SS type A sorting domain-containing protein [Bacteroidales bacterium]
ENENVNFNSVINIIPEIDRPSGIVAEDIQWTPAEFVTYPNSLNTSTIPLTEDMGPLVTLYLDITLSNGCTLSDSVKYGLELGVVAVEIVANPAVVCVGEAVTLSSLVTGGSGTYTYSWTSDPEGFTSSSASTSAMINQSTKFILSVTDEITTDVDTLLVEVKQKPGSVGLDGDNNNVNFNSRKEYVATEHLNWTYEWGVINGDIVSGQWSNILVVDWDSYSFGEVWVVPSNEYGCKGDTTRLTITLGTVGQDEQSELQNLNIYPNPFDHEVRVDYVLNKNSNVSIEVYSLLGNISYRKEWTNQKEGKYSHIIYADELSKYSGVLFLKITVDNKATTRKLIRLNE